MPHMRATATIVGTSMTTGTTTRMPRPTITATRPSTSMDRTLDTTLPLTTVTITAMATITPSTPDAEAASLSALSLLRLMQLTSPALPVGGFSYSEGLEAAVEAGLAIDENQATHWLLDQLHLGLARSDLAVAAKAFDAWRENDTAALAELNAWVQRTRESAELRQQSEQMGRSLLAWLRNRGAHERDDARLAMLTALEPAPNWVIAFALAAMQTGAARREVLLSLAFSWAENMVQAAMKCVPLGQASAQRMLVALIEHIPSAVEHAITLPMAERQAFTPMLAILSAQHETQYSRLFRS